MKKTLFVWMLMFLFTGLGDNQCVANENWRESFERICAHTADAGNLSSKELNRLIAESDELLKIVEASDDPERKFYLIKLKRCRNFFIFMGDIQKNSENK